MTTSGLRLAVGEEGEVLRLLGDVDDDRIDLEEAPLLVLARVAGERAGAEADDAEAAGLAFGVETRLHDLHRRRHGRARVIVGAGRDVGDDVARQVAEALRAVQRRAVRQHVEVAVLRLADAVDAVVAALRLRRA